MATLGGRRLSRPAFRAAALVAAAGLLAAPAFALVGPASSDPAVVGRWSEPFDGEVPAVNMVLLSDGRVLYWSGVEADGRDNVFFFDSPVDGEARVLLPPYDGSVVTPANPTGGDEDLFCSGNTVLADGSVLVAGGSDWTSLPGETAIVWGTTESRLFDLGTTGFEPTSPMRFGRWYPSIVLLPDGRGLAASGIYALTDPTTMQQTLEVFDPASASWSDLDGAENLLPMYPRLFVVPSGPMKGDVFYSTVGTLWGPFGEHPLEATWSFQQVLDLEDGWRTLGPSAFGARQHAAVVPLLLDPADDYSAKLLTFGGTLQRSVVATPLAELADLSTDPPTNAVVDPMNYPRWHLNGVLGPTGEVFAIGGGVYDNVVVHGQQDLGILPAESFDPATGEWTELAPMTVERMYHSTAILLPDGRILAGGHVPLPVPWTAARDNVPTQAQIVEKRLEVFEPPYLFRGDRPEILGVPDPNLSYGEGFVVTTHDEGVTAVLVRPGSTTHSFDADQRGVKLEFVGREGDSVTFRAPPDGDVAPPGWYMLFLLKDNGMGPTPSVAEFVHLD